jgi:hypothetical protein
LIINGNFNTPVLPANSFNYYDGGVTGWWAAKAELGDCRLFNPNWPASSGQCIDLDSDSNQRYMQTITITQSAFTSLIVASQSQARMGSITGLAAARMGL